MMSLIVYTINIFLWLNLAFFMGVTDKVLVWFTFVQISFKFVFRESVIKTLVKKEKSRLG